MAGNAWYFDATERDIQDVRKWCEENLTADCWFIAKMGRFATYDVCIGIEDEAMAFKLRWL